MGSFLPDTGTNACYMEEARHVAALDEDRGRTCVSIEWGSFYDEEALGPVLTTFDDALDHESLVPGAQRWWPGSGFPDSALGCHITVLSLFFLSLRACLWGEGVPGQTQNERPQSARTLSFQSLILQVSSGRLWLRVRNSRVKCLPAFLDPLAFLSGP